jgi:ABC-type transport system involved in cytochrome c biogenesis permease subunit
MSDDAKFFLMMLLAIVLLVALVVGIVWGTTWWDDKSCRDAGVKLGVATIRVDKVCYVDGEQLKPFDVYKWERGVR